MEIIDYIERLSTRLPDRNKNDPVFVAIISTLLQLLNTRQEEYINISNTLFDIDKSTGKNLDLIGNIIGQPRQLVNFITDPYFGFEGARYAESFDVGYWYSLYKSKLGTLKVLSDEEYRRVLKARVITNNTLCTRDDLLKVLNLLSNNNTAIIREESHGNISVEITDNDGMVSYFLSKYKDNDSVIPIPVGTKLITKYNY